MIIKPLFKKDIKKIIDDFPLLEAHLEERKSNPLYQEYPDIIYYYQAIKNDRIVGVAGIESIVFDNEVYLYLSPLEVIPEFKKKGVATALLNSVIDKAISTNRKGVILICKGELVSFYTRNGFITSNKFKEGDKNRFLMIFEKE